jgi:hypothetical protein
VTARIMSAGTQLSLQKCLLSPEVTARNKSLNTLKILSRQSVLTEQTSKNGELVRVTLSHQQTVLTSAVYILETAIQSNGLRLPETKIPKVHETLPFV